MTAPQPNSDCLRVERLLGDRPYPVFAGHYHRYTEHVRNNRQFITLATTGGGSDLRGTEFGEFDQVARVAMTDDGPVIAKVPAERIGSKLNKPDHSQRPPPCPVACSV